MTYGEAYCLTWAVSVSISAVCAAAGARCAESIDFSGRLGYNVITISLSVIKGEGGDQPEMKIRLLVSDENYDAIAAELIKKGIDIDDSAELILSESNVTVSHLIARRGDEIYRLETKNISHIESFAHDIVAYCGDEEYRLHETLRRLEEILDPKEFIRVSNSVIVSVSHIKSIRPALSQKFLLTMKNGAKVDVTRTYYYIFKEFLGI